MGIKFLCPHGHKLNVKTFLAGKKGVCPECGERFVIPLESSPLQRVVSIGVSTSGGHAEEVHTATADASPGYSAGAAASWNAGGAPAGVAAAPVAVAPAAGAGPLAGSVPQARSAAPAGNVAAIPQGPAAGWSGPAASVAPATVSVPSAPAPSVAAPVAAHDPLDEAPQATWYVRPPTGGQFGPAKGELLRRWIAEGRVSADSLVWREGWAEWRSAGGFLPGVGAPAAPLIAPTPHSVAPSYPSGTAALVGATPATSPSLLSPTSAADTTPARANLGRRPKSQLSVVWVIMLALLAIVMLVAVIYVIKSN